MAERYPLILINEDLPLFYKFPINPTSIDISSQKVYQESRTLGGYIFEHWGKTPTTLNVSGLFRTSSGTVQSEQKATSQFLGLRQLYELDKRRLTSLVGAFADGSLKKAYTDGDASLLKKMSSTILVYKDVIYTGFFTNFSYTESGNTPFHNAYKFSFLATYTSEDFIRDSLLRVTQTFKGTEIRSIVGVGLSLIR